MSRRETYETRTEELLLPIVERFGVEIYDVEYVKEGSDWYLRAYIDKPDGVNIIDCENVSRALSEEMDKADFIADAYILDAISCHTTGRPNMTLLDKIIYVADYISAERNYPDVDVMRDLSLNHSLEEASLYSLIYTFNKQTKLQGIIHPDSVEYYNELLMKGVKL